MIDKTPPKDLPDPPQNAAPRTQRRPRVSAERLAAALRANLKRRKAAGPEQAIPEEKPVED